MVVLISFYSKFSFKLLLSIHILLNSLKLNVLTFGDLVWRVATQTRRRIGGLF